MKKYCLGIICLLFGLGISPQAKSQVQALSGVINQYARVTGLPAPAQLSVDSSQHFSAGDQILIIQMTGATVNTGNNSSFGQITNYGATGSHEFAQIDSTSPQSLYLKCPLTRRYNPGVGVVQVVKVARYARAEVVAPLQAKAWDGNTGGILLLAVDQDLELQADIDLTGLGFRRGNRSCNSSVSGAPWVSTHCGYGRKGESIANYPLSRTSVGAIANGGGGGTYHNGGGGGGGAAGKGGRGKSTAWGGQGGYGGNMLDYDQGNRWFLGGGGGGGQQNDNHAQHGAAGGGIAIISVGDLHAVGHSILAKGANSERHNSTNNDGGGGAGGGGMILLQYQSLSGPLTLDASGGNSAAVCCGVDTYHGAGGGGGGGVIWTNNSQNSQQITQLVEGGIGDRNAEEGEPGQIWEELSLPQLQKGPNTYDCGIIDETSFTKNAHSATNTKVWPNPCQDQLNLQTIPGYDRWSLHNLQGQVQVQGKIGPSRTTEIDLYALPPGVYLLQLHGTAPPLSKKILKH